MAIHTFGEVMYLVRKQAGLTLEEAAKRIGTHKGYISGIENSKVNPPSMKIVERLYRLYKGTFLKKMGIPGTVMDLLEFAYVSKAPTLVRGRILDAIRPGNPFCIKIGTSF